MTEKVKVAKVTAAYRLPVWLARQVVIEAAHQGVKPYQYVEKALTRSVNKKRRPEPEEAAAN